MTNFLTCIAVLLLLVGCAKDPDVPPTRVVDQEVRRKVFMACLEKAPAGPQSTKYNDWDEVVEACGSEAYYIAIQSDDLLPAMRDEGVEQ